MVKIEMQFNSAAEAMEFLAMYQLRQDRGRQPLAAAAAAAATPKGEPTVATSETVTEDTPAPKAAPKKKAAPKAEPTPAPVEEEEEEVTPAPKAAAAKPEKVSFQQLRDIISKHTEVHGLEASKALLNKLGYVKASGIPEQEYATVYDKFEADLD